jgi:hypothetical protein
VRTTRAPTPVAAVFGELLGLVEERKLQTVTLADVWTAPPARPVRAQVTGPAPGR